MWTHLHHQWITGITVQVYLLLGFVLFMHFLPSIEDSLCRVFYIIRFFSPFYFWKLYILIRLCFISNLLRTARGQKGYWNKSSSKSLLCRSVLSFLLEHSVGGCLCGSPSKQTQSLKSWRQGLRPASVFLLSVSTQVSSEEKGL